MEELDQVIDESLDQEKKVPGIVKTLAIFSYVGNSLYALLFLAVVFLLESFQSQFVDKIEGAEISTSEFMLYMKIACVVIIAACIACIIGAYNMSKGKKWGFYIYAVFNAIWAILLIAGGTPQGIVVGISSIVFIVIYATQLRKFPA